MSDSDNVLRELRELLSRLRAGSADAYLEIHRILLANRLTPGDIEPGMTEPELRRLRREIPAVQARESLRALEAGDAAQYRQIVTIAAALGVLPERIVGKTHEELLALWRTAAEANAKRCLADPADPARRITLVDHCLWLDTDTSAIESS